MTHIPVEGGAIGSYPFAFQVLESNFESRPPTPKYLETWDVHGVMILC